MCGIAGLISKKTLYDERYTDFLKSSALMKHRGPDFTGHARFKNTLLVHHRLSIIDLKPHSNQPFQSSNPAISCVYNGEIYNYRELQKKYAIDTKTSSDTEIMIENFIQKGKNAVQEWNGIFAIAVLDKSENKITLIRDRFGVKPLYIFQNDEVFLFASEAKVILDWLPEFKLDNVGLAQYMWYGNTISEHTMVKGLSKVPPASIIEIDLTECAITSHSKFWVNKGTRNGQESVPVVIETIKLKLEEAVKRQMVADVPLGVLLSGGIDSSAIVAMASKHSSGKLDTYSAEYDFNIGGKSELERASIIAKKYNTNHHELKIEAKDIPDIFSELVFQYDEPFADAANIPLYQLAKACSVDKKVILQGDGGDELFAGYRRYNVVDWLFFWRTASFINHWLIPNKRWAERMKRISFVLNQPNNGMRMAYYLTQDVPYKDPLTILNPLIRERLKENNPFEPYLDIDRKHQNENLVQRLLYADLDILLPNTYLEKVDKATMFCSIEARVPFLDNHLAEYALGLPSKLKVQGGQKKILLKKALKGLLPDEILNGKKRGFDVPYKEWLKKDLFDFAIDSFENSDDNSILDKKYLLLILKKHQQGVSDYGSQLWKSLVLSYWLSKYKTKLIQ